VVSVDIGLMHFILLVRCVICAAFITGLLNNIGTHVDPIILIQKIREGLEIPGLRNSLVQILHDYYLQVKSLTYISLYIVTSAAMTKCHSGNGWRSSLSKNVHYSTIH